jgi:dTDP-4-dehydrorhamnose reductase
MPNRTAPWLVVGADSSIGAAAARRLVKAGIDVIGTTRRSSGDCVSRWRLDLAEAPECWQLSQAPVTVAVLCAAVTSVDRCREAPAATRRVNVEGTLALARRLREAGAHVVFLSTNQVFDGERPRRPAGDPTCPRTEYGRQKAEVEGELLRDGGATVVRLTKVVAPGMAVLRGWADALRRGEAVAPFTDMVFAPVPLDFVAGTLVRVGERRAGGIVQISGERDVSYAEVAARLARRLGAPEALVRPVSYVTKGLPPESAPCHTTLDDSRLRGEFGQAPPAVWETIDSLIEGTAHDDRE